MFVMDFKETDMDLLEGEPHSFSIKEFKHFFFCVTVL